MNIEGDFLKFQIDLLAAARCNMFSHALVAYQNAIIHFANKSNETYKHTLKNLAKEPHYNFTVLKELTQANPNEGAEEKVMQQREAKKEDMDKDQMLFFQVCWLKKVIEVEVQDPFFVLGRV
jgi:hypothetical protein